MTRQTLARAEANGIADVSEAFRRLFACDPRKRILLTMDNLHNVHDHSRFLAAPWSFKRGPEGSACRPQGVGSTGTENGW